MLVAYGDGDQPSNGRPVKRGSSDGLCDCGDCLGHRDHRRRPDSSQERRSRGQLRARPECLAPCDDPVRAHPPVPGVLPQVAIPSEELRTEAKPTTSTCPTSPTICSIRVIPRHDEWVKESTEMETDAESQKDHPEDTPS